MQQIANELIIREARSIEADVLAYRQNRMPWRRLRQSLRAYVPEEAMDAIAHTLSASALLDALTGYVGQRPVI